MAFSSPYLNQVEQNINSLLADKKFKEAYQIANQLLLKFPQNRKFIKIKERIQSEVRKENEKVIKKKLNDLKAFWRTEEYSKLLYGLREILKIDPENNDAKKQYIKAQRLYSEKIKKLEEEFEKNQREKFNNSLKTNETELINELFDLESKNPGNKLVQKLTKEYRTKLIQKKIFEQKALLESNKYKLIDEFIDSLEKIDPKNTLIKKLEKDIIEKRYGNALEEKDEFVYIGQIYFFIV